MAYNQLLIAHIMSKNNYEIFTIRPKFVLKLKMARIY